MFLAKLKTVAVVVLVVGAAAVGGGALTYRSLMARPPEIPGVPAETPVAVGGPEKAERVRIPGPRDGILLVIGTEIKEGEKVPPAQVVTVQAGGETKRYRRLRKGDRVEEGQLVARLDDRLARDEVAIKESKVIAAKADLDAAEKTKEEAYARFLKVQRLYKSKAISDEEFRGARLIWEKSAYDAVSKKEAVEVAKRELNQAQTILEMHQVRSRVRGVVREVLKHPGEAVRALEPLLEIQLADDPE